MTGRPSRFFVVRSPVFAEKENNKSTEKVQKSENKKRSHRTKEQKRGKSKKRERI